jgi:hypothetical protein
MKKERLFITCLLAALSLCATAQEYYDITEYYLKNSLFDSDYNYTAAQTGNVSQELLPIAGWTAAHTADYTIAGIYQIGTKKTFNGASVPAENVDGTTEGGVLALSTGWAMSLILTQSVNLPKGKYKLVSAYYNGDASVTAGTSLLAWIPSSGTSYKSKVTSFPVKQWVVDTLSFTYTTTKAGKIQIGFKAADGASGSSAKISVDYVKLLRDTPFGENDITVHKSSLKTLLSTANTQYGTGEKRGAAALKAVIDEAQAIYDNANVTFDEIDAVYAKLNEAVTIFKALQTADTALKNKLTNANRTAEGATGEGIDDLRAAITTAQAVYDNADATAEELTNAAAVLQAAIDTYNYSNPTGKIPTVVTDTRFVRGATMAFGRIKSVTSNGATIKTRGFCVSENPEPTINDILSSATLTNNGQIYWIKDLKPATKYYMRAYAVTSGYQVAYGEAIKFYTIPMGNVRFSYNNGGSAAENERINNALTEACWYFNNLIYTSRKFNVGYGSGTPTADCNYQEEPWMNVGPNASYQRTGTIMHEMEHGLGLQNYLTQWSKGNLRTGVNSGNWTGDRANEALRFWDNDNTAVLKGDGIHMWPYGINGASEDNGSDLLYLGNAILCQGLGEDGLEHNETRHADPYYSLNQEDDIKYYLKNESESRGLYTSYLIPTAAGALKWREMTAAEAAANDSTAWYITFTPSNQYYQFRNAATGQYLTYSGGIKTLKRTSLTANDDWHLMKGRVDVDGQRGYWIIHPQTGWTPPCLQANANGATGSASFNIANSAETQRWLIMTLDEMQAAEIKAVSSMKATANDVIAKIKALQEVPHTEDIPGIDQTTTDAIQSLEARIADATSTTEVLAIINEAQQAANGFLQNVSPSDPATPFDLTYMLVNPDMKSGNDGWSGTASINYECGEFYQTTFDYYQTVTGLPAGNYAFAANAFQRPGPYASASSVNTNATIYAGSKSAKLAHIKDDAQAQKVGTGNEVTMNGKYIPDNMQAASAYFKKGFYENRVFSSVANNGGSLKMGLKSTSMGSKYWVIFTNFRLYFYGKMSEETVLGINELGTEAPSQRKAVFTLDGRQLSPDAQLRPGLYIIDGRKTIVR